MYNYVMYLHTYIHTYVRLGIYLQFLALNSPFKNMKSLKTNLSDLNTLPNIIQM